MYSTAAARAQEWEFAASETPVGAATGHGGTGHGDVGVDAAVNRGMGHGDVGGDAAASRGVGHGDVPYGGSAGRSELRNVALDGETAREAPSIVLRRLIGSWTPPDFSAPVADPSRLPLGHQSLEPPQFTWVGETSRHIGTVVHAALEAFADATVLPTPSHIEADRDVYRHHLRRHGVPDRDLEQATAVVVEALTRTVGDERGRWILSQEHREAHSELTLTGIANGRLTDAVIDRSFVDQDGTRWVIDFKTSRHEGGGLDAFLKRELERYRAQLETYVALARGLGPHPVRAGLYFPLIGAFREL